MRFYIASSADDLGGPKWATLRRSGAGLLFCKGGDELGAHPPSRWKSAAACHVNDVSALSAPDVYGVLSGLSSISEFLEKGHSIVFRSQAGISRSTAFAVATLIRVGLTAEVAAKRLLTVRPEAYPNEAICRTADAVWSANGEIIRAGALVRKSSLWGGG